MIGLVGLRSTSVEPALLFSGLRIVKDDMSD